METGVNIFLDLILNCLQDLFIAMPDIVHTDATCKINVFLPFDISNDRPFGLFRKDTLNGPWGICLFLSASKDSLLFMGLTSFLIRFRPWS
jgi:hypothetical protein